MKDRLSLYMKLNGTKVRSSRQGSFLRRAKHEINRNGPWKAYLKVGYDKHNFNDAVFTNKKDFLNGYLAFTEKSLVKSIRGGDVT